MKSGTSMLELVAYIVVASLLTTLGYPYFVNVRNDAKITTEKYKMGEIRTAINIINSRSIVKNGNFKTSFIDGDGNKKGMIMEVTSSHNPIALSLETTPRGDGYYYITENPSLITSGTRNNYTLATVLPLDSRNNLESGSTFTSDGTKERCDENSTNCKQYVEGSATSRNGILESENTFEINRKYGWEYDAMTGNVLLKSEKKDTTGINVGTDTSPDF